MKTPTTSSSNGYSPRIPCGKSYKPDTVSAAVFLNEFLDDFKSYLASYNADKDKLLLPAGIPFHYSVFEDELKKSFDTLKEKCQTHPELFGVEEGAKEGEAKILLDALYEEGIIPTYSFPKNVVSTYIPDAYGKILYEVDRGLDVAIGEYAPGRAIVVDKQPIRLVDSTILEANAVMVNL